MHDSFVALLGIFMDPVVYSVADTRGMTHIMGIDTKHEWEQMTGLAELGEGCGAAPGDRSVGRTELNTCQSVHIVTQNGLSELDRVRDEGGRRPPPEI